MPLFARAARLTGAQPWLLPMTPVLPWPDAVLALKYWQWLLSGWSVTMGTSLLVIALSTLLGVLFAMARDAAAPALRTAAGVYLSVFRNTPHELALGGWHLAWPSLEFLSAAVGLVLYSTAYVGEEIRAGIANVPRSQLQAALSLGMTRWQSLRHIVLPQALAHVVSPLCGQYMNITKNTSLGMTIGLVELSYRARQAEAETFQSFQVYGISTVLYIVLIIGLELLSRQVQRRRRWGRLPVGRT